MDIVVINSAFVRNEEPKKRVTRVPGKRSDFVEKRRNRTDRRKSVRDGVVVSLSYRKDRRTGPDRRQAESD
ncbi:hypothetical protein [uncultured Desulfosarcina sp.]|uniref:hypothetical protein n=1 Tax=uncultured Desulfosarcina sp. TaxID=218289 RepID=UPI0029C6D75A|nr:hypothetical protein [uncultured Desulfosarcina sp.]